MPKSRINGVELYWELTGNTGEPLVLVHGSWVDHHSWDHVVPELARTFRVVTYDRRGHSQSERPAGQGSITEDVADLCALVEYIGIAPAHVAGNSGGAAVALRTAATRPEIFRTLIAHEPPLFGLLADEPQAQDVLRAIGERIGAVAKLLEAADMAAAARLFVETIAFGPGEWDRLPLEMQQTFIFNAPTFLDELGDPQSLLLDFNALRRFVQPALLSRGELSAPFFPIVVSKIANAMPNAELRTFPGAGHVPQLTHPADYASMVREFVARAAIPLNAS